MAYRLADCDLKPMGDDFLTQQQSPAHICDGCPDAPLCEEAYRCPATMCAIAFEMVDERMSQAAR